MIGTRWSGASRGACAALAAVALGAGAAACGSGGAVISTGSSGVSAGATNAAATAPATSPHAPSTNAPARAARTSSPVTAPGTKLSVGQSAKVAYAPAGSSGSGRSSTLLLTVRSVEKGSLADFNGIQLDATQKASTPYYVKVHVKNLGPHPIDVDASAAAIEGVDDTGNNQQSVTFIGTFPRCPDQASTTPLGAGRGYDDCLTFLVPGGITKVSYNGTTNYIDSPVTWTAN